MGLLIQILDPTSIVSLTFLGLTIPIYIFAVTLLGDAIEKVKEEKDKYKKDRKKNLDKRIDDLEKKIKKAKSGGDQEMRELESDLAVLYFDRETTQIEIDEIKERFSYLEFKKCVLYPSFFFLLSIIVIELAKFTDLFDVKLIFWLFSVSSITIGIRRLYKSLNLIQTISSVSNEYQTKRFSVAVKEALLEHDKSNDISLIARFPETTFPIKVEKNKEFTIHFNISLESGKFASDPQITFYLDDNFEDVDPKHYTRENDKFVIPNTKLVNVKFSALSKGKRMDGSVKIKSSSNKGKFMIKYRMFAQGYASEFRNLEIEVE